jgi:hypothetical protein
MKEQTRLDVLALCDAAERMRDAANNLWWANNVSEGNTIGEGVAPTIEEAELAHGEAFEKLAKAEFSVRRCLNKEGAHK